MINLKSAIELIQSDLEFFRDQDGHVREVLEKMAQQIQDLEEDILWASVCLHVLVIVSSCFDLIRV